MTNLELAQIVLDQTPLPENAEAQIDALFASATEDEKPLFVWIYEGLAVMQDAVAETTIELDLPG